MPQRVSRDLPKEISLSPAYPGYVLVRRLYVGHVPADPRDDDRRPFKVEYDIRRLLRGRRSRARGERFDRRPVTPKPCEHSNRRGRWQLEVRFHVGRRLARTSYHRIVALKIHYCTTDQWGMEIEPFQARLGGLTNGLYDEWWEVDHDDGNTRNNLLDNLYIYWWAYHRTLER